MVSVVRGSVIAMVIALMIGAVVAYFTPAGSASGGNEPADLQAEVREALEGFFAALLTGEPDRVAATLAPEFQIMRADGSNYDANGYPQGELPIISEMPAIEKLNVTAEGGIAVAAYYVNIDQTRDGKLVEAYAPRLSVFRKDGDRWLLVAHGNFAPLKQ